MIGDGEATRRMMEAEKQKSTNFVFIAPEGDEFPAPFVELRRDLESYGINTVTVPSRLGPQGSIDLLGWTVFVGLMLKPFFTAMLSEMGKQAGKDLYSLLKSGWGNLWSRIGTPTGISKVSVINSKGPVSEYSFTFSLMAEFRWGHVNCCSGRNTNWKSSIAPWNSFLI